MELREASLSSICVEEWRDRGALLVPCILSVKKRAKGAVSDLRVTNRGNGTLENELLWKGEEDEECSTFNVEC